VDKPGDGSAGAGVRRGERKLYRELARAATAVAESDNYAKEYMAKARFRNAEVELLKLIALTPSRPDPMSPTRSEQSLEGTAVNGLTPVGQEDEL
jgi:hypothetical protein